MKKVIGWLVSYALFWAGHFVSRCLICNHFALMYPVYHRLMVWSCDVNDWAGLDIWGPPQK